jgi:hypothetical protein
MFDNLREQAESVPFYEDEAEFNQVESAPVKPPKPPTNGQFLGMTPLQRFIIAIMLLIAVCSLGSMCLLITGKIGLF